MSNIKNLATQTMWYGLSSIAARLINYLLTPYLTYSKGVNVADFGQMGLIYSAIPILNVLFTYGFETAFFRFSSQSENKDRIYSTAFLSMLMTTLCFTGILWHYQGALGRIVGVSGVPQLVQMSIFIIALDTLAAIPFARLRLQGRPIKYATIRISGILINVFLTWFFISYCRLAVEQDPYSWTTLFYRKGTSPIVYVVLANLVQSAFTLLLLYTEIREVRWQFNFPLWKSMLLYAWPLIIAGMGGTINETFDRLMLSWWLPGDAIANAEQVGIYNACYKLAILITLFIQAFRMGAEPFFFKQAETGNPQRIYARVMKFFVIIITFMFLVVALYMPVWKHFIGPRYWEGLKVVPVLLLANMFLGIYLNLSVWYKLGKTTGAGAWITLLGAAITILINFYFIPRFGYMACAWATFSCYGSMMALSFVWGQKVYRIPYAWKKLLAYLVIVVLLYFIHRGITHWYSNTWFSLALATLLTGAYGWFLANVERKELPSLPVVGRYFHKKT